LLGCGYGAPSIITTLGGDAMVSNCERIAFVAYVLDLATFYAIHRWVLVIYG